MNSSQQSNGDVEIVRFDWAMKSLLRDKANFDILEGFLHVLLGEPLTIQDVIVSEDQPESETAKQDRFDVMAQDAAGRRVIVEIQNDWQSDYIRRLLYGAAEEPADRSSVADKYRDRPKIVVVHILFFHLREGDDYVYSGTTEVKGRHTGETLTAYEEYLEKSGEKRRRPQNVSPEYHVIDVGGFEPNGAKREEALDQWIHLFQKLKVRSDFDAPGIAKAREKLACLEMKVKDFRRYQRYMDDVRDERSVMEGAEEQGRLEEQERLAVRLKKEGFSTEKIADLTGLHPDEVSWLFK